MTDQNPSAGPTAGGLVDTHAHFVTDEYVTAALSAGIAHPDRMPSWPTWSERAHLALMGAIGIQRSILSISSPGVHFGDARRLARQVNQSAAQITARRPDRFGFFASLPLPDVEGALAEVPRAWAAGASGFVVETSPGGVYLSHPRYEPLWAELNRRGAVVFVHPTSPPGCEATDHGFPRPMLEFVFDTTRTFTGLIAAGVLTRHPRIRWIVPHAGSALPLLVDRIQFVLDLVHDSEGAEQNPHVRHQLAALWYDTAGFPLPTQLPALVGIADPSHLLFGSDYCWTPGATVQRTVRSLDHYYQDKADDWRNDYARNASALLA